MSLIRKSITARAEGLLSTVRVHASPWISVIRQQALYPKTRFGRGVIVDGACSFGDHVSIGPDSMVASSHFGRHSYLAFRDWVRGTRIGAFCSIGPNVIIGIGRHPSRDFVSTHPALYSSAYPGHFTKHAFEEHLPVEIGSDVWIGAGAFIAGGLRVGSGAIIGSGAIVTHDVEPYAVVTGTPARVVRKRFEPQEVEFLLETRWWEWPDARLREFGSHFDDVQALRRAVEGT